MLDARVRIRTGNGPAVRGDLAPHRCGQLRAALETQGQHGRSEIGPCARAMARRGAGEGLEPGERRKEQETEALSEVPDDRQARAHDAEPRNVHTNNLPVE